MRVLFLQDNGLNESLLVTETAAALRAAGHQASLLLEREERDLRGAIQQDSPDLVLLPAAVQAHHWTVAICGRLRRWFPDLPVALAGTLPTFFPEVVQRPGVRMVILGEAEQAALDICDALAGKRRLSTVPNLHLRRGKVVVRNDLGPLVPDLDALPLPHRRLYYDRYPFLGAFPWKKFSTGRGCFHGCSYCYQPHYRRMCAGKGAYVRRKSPGRVVAEVEDMRAHHALGNVHFADDLFITRTSWLREFAQLYPGRVGLPYSINTSADLVDEPAARLLAESGCRAVAIGVEAGSEQRRREILGKDLPDGVIRRAAELIRGHGMRLITFNMLGAPGEGWQDALDTLKLNIDIGASHARVTICQPIPGTPMARDAAAAGESLEGAAEDIFQVPDAGRGRAQVYFRSAAPQQGQFINLFHLFSLAARYPSLAPAVRAACHLPPNPIFSLGGGLLRMLQERAAYRFSLLAGLRYFMHVGNPGLRTANFVGLI